jgi:long-chain acyl-CoA synthetase
LAQGEYVSPERLENFYITHPGIGTMFVHGDSTQTSLVAIIGVDPEPFAAWASKIVRRAITVSDIASVCNDSAVIKHMIKDLDRIAEKRKLQGFEKVKGIYLALEPFTVENDLLTPTLKLKRSEASKAFRKEIDELYNQIDQKLGKVQAKL